jgi:membrane fusion protein, multidrug efflux system
MNQHQAPHRAEPREPEETLWGQPERGSFTAELRMPPPPDERIHAQKSAPVKVGRAITLLVIAAIAVAYTGITQRRDDAENLKRWTQEQAIPTVALVTPQRGGEARDLVLPGNVNAYYSANIHGQVKGYVREWREDIGAKVHQGEVLAVVDTPELDQSIEVAQSELAKAKANLALAKVTASRWSSLRASAAVSQQAADEKEADAKARAAEVEAAQSNVDRLKAQKAFANIVAPFDGVVTARNVDVGSLVRADGTNNPALFTVADIHQVRIYVPVPESYAAELKDGLKATLSLPEYPDRTFDATIMTTSHAIDQKSRSLLVELIADNPEGKLSPGAFTRVHFRLPPDPVAVRIPASALLFRDNAVQIATVGMDNRIKLRKVRIARDFGSEVEIAGGLNGDERLVANPSDSIDEGEEVRIAKAADEKAQGASGPGPHAKSAEDMAETGRTGDE